MTTNVNPAVQGASTGGGGFSGFFESIIESGQGAAVEWWEGRLDTEIALSNQKDAERLGISGVASQGAGVDDIDNASPFSGLDNNSNNTLLYFGLGAVAIAAILLAAKT